MGFDLPFLDPEGAAPDGDVVIVAADASEVGERLYFAAERLFRRMPREIGWYRPRGRADLLVATQTFPLGPGSRRLPGFRAADAVRA